MPDHSSGRSSHDINVTAPYANPRPRTTVTTQPNLKDPLRQTRSARCMKAGPKLHGIRVWRPGQEAATRPVVSATALACRRRLRNQVKSVAELADAGVRPCRGIKKGSTAAPFFVQANCLLRLRLEARLELFEIGRASCRERVAISEGEEV